ncbi:hypothetical protein RRG08_053058 [Elysia crispata]|uniref:Uncharacterized protein n=1 Tax=Elysia crispata TaxID=231223 RepID=A0AAE0XTE8_9GAST|nr:hypothetical protein RRG08_053058 [Elysia crispata]
MVPEWKHGAGDGGRDIAPMKDMNVSELAQSLSLQHSACFMGLGGSASSAVSLTSGALYTFLKSLSLRPRQLARPL